MNEFPALWQRTCDAAHAAAVRENDKLGNETARGFDCGFAWIQMPGTLPISKWLKKEGIASKHWERGNYVWYSKLHDVSTQSISVHEAACRAARDYLAHALQTSAISMGSRLD